MVKNPGDLAMNVWFNQIFANGKPYLQGGIGVLADLARAPGNLRHAYVGLQEAFDQRLEDAFINGPTGHHPTGLLSNEGHDDDLEADLGEWR